MRGWRWPGWRNPGTGLGNPHYGGPRRRMPSLSFYPTHFYLQWSETEGCRPIEAVVLSLRSLIAPPVSQIPDRDIGMGMGMGLVCLSVPKAGWRLRVRGEIVAFVLALWTEWACLDSVP
jgi:hypothetical protein